MRCDDFGQLARYYDPLMEHVNYARWFRTCVGLAELLPAHFVHLDAGCGTGVLVQALRDAGWRSVGVDLSPAMVSIARKQRRGVPVAVADVRALPMSDSVHFVTCLFDSINFLLEEEDVVRALREIAAALRPGGMLYFDIVTERMVTEHFAGQSWEEENGSFFSNWSSSYNRRTACTETRIRINTGAESVIRERIYAEKVFKRAIRAAGLTLLGAYDVEGWVAPSRRTTRIDFIAVKGPGADLARRFKAVANAIRDTFEEA